MMRRVNPDRLQPAYDLLARQVALGDVPAAVLAVANAAGTVRSGAFSPGRERVTPASRFMVASITKPIVAAAVMQLVDAGRLELDAPVATYLREFSPPGPAPGEPGGEAVTTRMILSHTAGLGEDWERMRKELPSAPRVYEVLCSEPLLFAPGTRFRYTSNSYFVLGELIRRMSGQAYPEYVRRNVLEPLGMSATSFGIPRHDRAPVHGFGPSRVLQPLYVRAFAGLAHPGGGLWGNAADVLRFGRAMLRGGELDGVRILARESVAQMTRLQTADLPNDEEPGRAARYGLGWGLPGLDPLLTGSADAFDHGGSTGCRLWVDPGADLTIVYLSNRWRSETRFGLAAIQAVYEALGLGAGRSIGTTTAEPQPVPEAS